MRFYSPTFFKPYEYLPKDVYEKMGDSGIILMDARILWTIDAIRKTVNLPITINNWKSGGPFSQRGFRNDDTGAVYSQHRFGRAVDMDIHGMTADEFRNKIKAGQINTELTYITRIEEGVNWIHLDCASVPGTEMVFFKQ
jgi:hypothetical protein